MPAPPKCDLDTQQLPIKALIFGLVGTCLDWHSAVSPVLLRAFSIPEGEKPAFTAVKWRHECLDGYYDSSETGFPREDVDYTCRRVLLDMVQSHRVEMDGVEVEACVKAWHEQVGMHSFLFGTDQILYLLKADLLNTLLCHQHGRTWLQHCLC
jgi:hypothetical protein